MLGEEIGVGGNDAEEIVERVRDSLGAGTGSLVRQIEGYLHGRILSSMRMRVKVREGREDGGQKSVGIERFHSESVRGADISGFVLEVVHGRRIKSQDGKSRIFGTDFVDVMKSLKVPGQDIERDRVPASAGKDEEELVEGLSPMDFDACAWGDSESLRKLGPGEIFAEVEKVER